MLIDTADNNVAIFRINYLNKGRFQLIFLIHIKFNLWFIRQVIGYIKHCYTPPPIGFVGVNSKEYLFKGATKL